MDGTGSDGIKIDTTHFMAAMFLFISLALSLVVNFYSYGPIYRVRIGPIY
jgi:hypothetical protein